MADTSPVAGSHGERAGPIGSALSRAAQAGRAPAAQAYGGAVTVLSGDVGIEAASAARVEGLGAMDVGPANDGVERPVDVVGVHGRRVSLVLG